MAPAFFSRKARRADSSRPETACLDERRLDPGLGRLTDCAPPPSTPAYFAIGFPICFTLALGILLIRAHTLEAMVCLALGATGLVIVRYLNRHS